MKTVLRVCAVLGVLVFPVLLWALPSEEQACSNHRWVGAVREGLCPPSTVAHGGVWVQSYLFASNRVALSRLPRQMRNYCVYDWQPTTPQAVPQPDALPFSGNAAWWTWLARDCQVSVTSGDSSAALLMQAPHVTGLLNHRFLRQLEMPKELPYLVRGAKPPSVRIAVLDTLPRAEGGTVSPALFEHGWTVAKLIDQITCPMLGSSGACVGYLSTHLALPLRVKETTVVRDTTGGGFFGSQMDMARALYEAVTAWVGSDNPTAVSSAQKRLVINISAGWDPVFANAGWSQQYKSAYQVFYGGQNMQRLTPAALAVRQAITHAVCKGAVVVAAAGNRSTGQTATTGPMFPAVWETVPAPTREECMLFEDGVSNGAWVTYESAMASRGTPIFGSSNTFTTATTTARSTLSRYQPLYRPLVYSVGAVDAADEILANHRRGARPRQAAPGALGGGVWAVDWVRLSAGDPMAFTGTESLTGTSISAAAVSAVAAVLWAYRPEIAVWNMMQGVYASGVSLDPYRGGSTPVRAEYCVGNTGCGTMPVRRVSVCGALTAACASGRCQSFACDNAHLAYVDARATLDAEVALAVDAFYKTSFAEAITWDEQSSSDVFEIDASSIPDVLFENHHTQPWVFSQPGVGPCPYCSIAINWNTGLPNPMADMSLAIAPAWVGVLSNPVLELKTTVGTKYFSLASPVLQNLEGGDEAHALLTSVPLASSAKVQGAALLFTQNNGTPLSVRQDMLFWEQ
jgi:hypothetical protein